MFNVQKSASRVVIETGNAIYEWDAAKGGQLTGLTIKDGDRRRTLIDADHAAPNLTVKTPKGVVRVADYPSKFKFEYEEDEYIVFSAQVKLGDQFTFEQQYEVFRESVVFCEFRLMINDGVKVNITDAELGFDLDLDNATNVRSNWVSRDPYLKQDVTTTHVLAEIHIANDPRKKIRAKQLIPLVGLDLGWDKARCYGHRVELVMEDNSSIGGRMLDPTHTDSAKSGGRWNHKWTLCRNHKQTLEKPFFYRNKWALFVASARTEAGAKADPVRRNNALGARVCHVMYPYIYGVRNWPWSSVPVRQTFYQDVQIAKEQPPLKTVDQAVELGCNILIIHQFWMKNGGSNGEPQANYQVHDPKWLKSFIKRAHEKGMRVLLYGRGVEHYQLYMDYFEKYLKKNWDGLYLDWATPFAMGFAKCTSRHSSVYNYFMWAREARKRVGEGGLLIGHTMQQSAASYACFDATITGEFSVLHTGLLAEPEVSTSYAGLACAGVHLIAGNSPDRAMFSSQKAAAYAAGLGWAANPFAEPGVDFAKASAFTKPLWDMINCLETDPVRAYNPSVDAEPFATWSDKALYPLAYQDKKGNVLITVANLSEKPVAGEVEIDPALLQAKRGAELTPLRIRKAARAKAKGHTISVDLEPYDYCAVMLAKPKK